MTKFAASELIIRRLRDNARAVEKQQERPGEAEQNPMNHAFRAQRLEVLKLQEPYIAELEERLQKYTHDPTNPMVSIIHSRLATLQAADALIQLGFKCVQAFRGRGYVEEKGEKKLNTAKIEAAREIGNNMLSTFAGMNAMLDCVQKGELSPAKALWIGFKALCYGVTLAVVGCFNVFDKDKNFIVGTGAGFWEGCAKSYRDSLEKLDVTYDAPIGGKVADLNVVGLPTIVPSATEVEQDPEPAPDFSTNM
jgi:hypothetical protein